MEIDFNSGFASFAITFPDFTFPDTQPIQQPIPEIQYINATTGGLSNSNNLLLGSAAYYAFTSLLTDSSGNSNNLISHGAVIGPGIIGTGSSYTASSYNGGTQTYDAGQYLVLPGPFQLGGSLPMSISFWFNAPVDVNAPTAAIMISKYDNTGNQREYKVYLTYSSTSTVALHANISSNGISSVQFFSGISYSTNVWHYVTFVFNVNSAILYVDGLVDIANSGIPSFFHGTAPFTLGCNYSATVPNTFYNGLLDEVSIIYQAYTPAQVATLYNAGRGYTWTPLVPTISIEAGPN